MHERMYPESSRELEEYEFTYIFPGQSVKEVNDTFESTVLHKADFEYLPYVYANRLRPDTIPMYVNRINEIDSKTIAEARDDMITPWDQFCEGWPEASLEQKKKFESDLGSIVSAKNQGLYMADAMLYWTITNAKKVSSNDEYIQNYERDLLIVAGLFRNAADVIVKESVNDEQDLAQFKSRILREMFYVVFPYLRTEPQLIASTIYTNDYTDPFHYEVDRTARLHEQLNAAYTLELAKTGLRAYAKSRKLLDKKNLSVEKTRKYMRLSSKLAQVAMPDILRNKGTYPAYKKLLADENVVEYFDTEQEEWLY